MHFSADVHLSGGRASRRQAGLPARLSSRAEHGVGALPPGRQFLGRAWPGGDAAGPRSKGLPMSRMTLRKALDLGQIQAWFQPKVSVDSQRLAGAEALARWLHPELGLLAPAAFLPWFSHHGLDEALLMHMLKEALAIQAQWRRQGIQVPISVNLPTHLLNDVFLPDRLLNRVRELQGRTCCITFEILESSNTLTARALLRGASRLVSMGFGLAQDDFGIGYSSMRRLSSLPFSELKLDRSFVHGAAREERQAATVLASIRAGKRRGLAVTAEGVETPEDLAFLRQAGCDYAQGYLFAKPLSAADMNVWLAGTGADRPGLALSLAG
ncbi:MAG: EAL domain-containing protein [Alcaligenes sp.]